MGVHGADDIPFDYDGVLVLCRELWSLADELSSLMSKRAGLAATAATSWEGPYKTDFDSRRENEVTPAAQIVSGLRSDAEAWAGQWKAAMDETNRRRWARHHDEWKKDNDGFLDHLFGATDHTPNPEPVGVPQSPGFAATGSLVSY